MLIGTAHGTRRQHNRHRPVRSGVRTAQLRHRARRHQAVARAPRRGHPEARGRRGRAQGGDGQGGAGGGDEFYENYNNKKDKNVATTRKDAEAFLAAREDTTAGGTSWERIAKLVDVRGGKGGAAQAAGKEKFRDMLTSLMKDENAPGAKGY
ncbi:hypothetical protein MRB53_037628 [Persea americana]|nr:hypothetical protein MRB53_037628 [Persea americana]